MKLVIVPNGLSDAIYAKIDDKFKGITITEIERKAHFDTLLDFYDQHGFVPDFEVKKQDSIRESTKEKE